MPAPLREAARHLARTPIFTAATVLSLAIGIGLAVSVFSVAHAVFLAPLPYDAPDRLVEIWQTPSPTNDSPSDYLQPDRMEAWAESELRFLDGLAGRGLGAPLVMRTPAGAVRVRAEPIVGDWFGVLGSPAARGRVLGRADVRPGAEPAAVVSHAFWRKRLSDRGDGLGRTLDLAGTAFTVVGVMPPTFAAREVVWLPVAALPPTRRPVAYAGIGRLRASATVDDAAREVRRLAAVQVAADSGRWGGKGATATGMGRMARRGEKPALWLLAGAVGAVLLVGLANLSNLFLVRARRRSVALAIRASLGATTWQLGRGLAVEALLLGLGGSALGLLLATWGKDLVRTLMGAEYSAPGEPVLGLAATAAAVGLGLFVTLVVGLEPLRRIRSLDMRALLQRRSGGVAGSRSERRTRNVMVGVQVAVSIVLVAVMGVVAGAYREFTGLEVGYDAGRVVQATADYELAGMEPDAQWALARRVAEAVRPHPAVDGVALWRFVAQDYPPRPEFDAVMDGEPRRLSPRQRVYSYYEVETGSLEALGIDLVRGRTFTDADGAGAPPVAIVTAGGAQAWWPGENPLGRRIKLGRNGRWMTVVGVVDDVQRLGPFGRTFGFSGRYLPVLFRPAAQRGTPPAGWHADRCGSCAGVVIGARAAADPAEATAALRNALAVGAPDLPLREMGVMLDRQVATGFGRDIIEMGRLVALAVLAGIALAVLGIVGVVADGVARRTREIGVRMAIGARPARILLAVVRESAVTALAGMAAGLLALILLHETIETIFFAYVVRNLGTGLVDPLLLATAAGTVLAITAAASLLPARRALRVDPAEALRSE